MGTAGRNCGQTQGAPHRQFVPKARRRGTRPTSPRCIQAINMNRK